MASALLYCFEIRAAIRIQRAARDYLARLPALRASIERDFRELMELHQEQLEEQKPFHEAWDLELAKKAEDTYAIIDGWFVSKFCPCRPGECPCNPPLAIMDGPP